MKAMTQITSVALIAVTTLVFSVSCSNHWREGSSDINDEVMLSSLNEISSGQVSGSNTGSISQIIAMKDQGAAIYYAEAPGNMGPVAAVLNVDNLQVLGAPVGTNYFNVSAARIFFFDLVTDSGRQTGLIIGIKTDGASDFSYSSFLGTGAMNGDSYEATFSGNGSDFALKTFDVDGDDLSAVIQLRVFQGGSYIGKFSTLIGFGG